MGFFFFSFLSSIVSGAEIWLLPLQQVQYPLGERVRLVHLWNLQGSRTASWSLDRKRTAFQVTTLNQGLASVKPRYT